MTDRIPLDHLTSDDLDALYATLEFTEAALSRMRDRLEVTHVRVRRVADQIALDSPWGRSTAGRIRAALDEPAAGPAAPGSILDPDWLHQQYTSAIRDTPARYPDDIATAILRVRDRHLDQLRGRLALADAELQQWAAAESADAAAGSYAMRAETAEQQRDQNADALRRAHDTIRQQHTTLTRIRNIDPTPPQVDPDSETGRAYTTGWQAALDRVTTELVDTPREQP